MHSVVFVHVCFRGLSHLSRRLCAIRTHPRLLQRRKTNNKPRDASTPHGSTAAESVRNLIKRNPKYSKRINYNALKDLFTDDGAAFQMPAGDGEEGKDDDEGALLYTMDDKSDGEGMLVVDEPGGGGVGKAKSRSASLVPNLGAAVPGTSAAGGGGEGEGDDEEDAEGEEDVEEEKDDTYGEWDAYEQEV